MNRKQKARRHQRRVAHQLHGREKQAQRQALDAELAKLPNMTKFDLVDFATEHDIAVASRWTKQRMIEVIETTLTVRSLPTPRSMPEKLALKKAA